MRIARLKVKRNKKPISQNEAKELPEREEAPEVIPSREVKTPTEDIPSHGASNEFNSDQPRVSKTIRQGYELIHFYKFIELSIGSDTLADAKEKRNKLGGTVSIFEILNDLNILRFDESAQQCFNAFKEAIPNLKLGRLSELTLEKGVTLYKGEEIKPCFTPQVAEKKPQIILPYNDYSEFIRMKNENSNERVVEGPRRESSLKGKSSSSFTISDLVKDAKDQGASDIHVTYSFTKNLYNVLFVLDGISVLQNKYIMNHEQGAGFVSHIKTEAAPFSKGGFNPEISYKAQDATIKFPVMGVDIRIVFIPDGMLTHNSVTMRLLKKQSIERGDFDFVKNMGYSEQFAKMIGRVKEQRNGIFIASGVTGSGKSTLTSHIIATIPATERIYTVEDPIEYIIDGPNVTQHQIYIPPPNPDGTDSDKKMGWKEYIKALKRAAPDVVNIGEFRNDPELSKMVVEMSEAGQLVFTTVHIKSAFSIYEALEEVFGIKYETSAQILLFSTNQVLVRELCNSCKVKDVDYENKRILEELHENKEIRYAYDKRLSLFIKNMDEHSDTYLKGKDSSCSKCGGTGYSGRIPVAEYFKPSQKFVEFLLEGRPKPHEIEKWVCQRQIGENKLDRYIQLIKEGRVDTSHDIIRKII